MTNDDRIEFERARRDAATRMRADPELAAAAVALDRAADRHDWLYQWSWLGLPVIQTPSDIARIIQGRSRPIAKFTKAASPEPTGGFLNWFLVSLLIH